MRRLMPQQWAPSGPQLTASPVPPAQQFLGEEKRKRVGENNMQ